MKHYSILVTTLLLILSLASCHGVHFGDVEDVRPTFSDTERDCKLFFGVVGAWDFNNTDLALMGTSFIGDRDTSYIVNEEMQIETVIKQKKAPVVQLSFVDSDFDPDANIEYNYAGGARLKLKNGGTDDFVVLSPYRAFQHLTADTSEVTLDFATQDGTLSSIRENCNYGQAWVVAQCDSMSVQGILHNILDPVTLNRKYCTIRLNLVNADASLSLISRLRQRAFGLGKNCGITSVQLAELEDSPLFGDAALLDVFNGAVTLVPRCNHSITMRQADGHNMVDYQICDVSPSDAEISLNGASWGSACYAAFPCVSGQGLVRLSLRVIVHCLIGNEELTYYGVLSPDFVYAEGKTYTTAPIRCFTSMEEAWQHPADIFEF